MTTAKHCMYLTKCCELLAWQCMSLYGYGELNIMQRTYSFVDYYNYDVSNLQGLEPASFKFYQNSNWSLHHSESEGLEETQAEAKTQSLPIGTGRPTTFEYLGLGVGQLCSKNNNQCCSCGLSNFRPTEAILTHLRKIRNTQLRFVFLNFSFVCQSSLRWSKTR